jgi:hypothetical protein
MTPLRPVIGLTLLALALTACSDRVQYDGSGARISRVDSSHIAVHARDIADAVIASDGGLEIDGKAVTLTAAQKENLRDYYEAADALRADAIATGKAGLATAGTAIGSVVKGLLSGEPEKIGPTVDVQAAKVEASAAKICADLRVLQAKQDAIAAQLPAFKPYATITSRDSAKCDH